MSSTPESIGPKLLKEIQALNLDDATVKVYLARRYTSKTGLTATLRSVGAGTTLTAKIRSVTSKVIKKSNTVRDYEPETTDADGALFIENHAEAHWDEIHKKLLNGDAESAKSVDDLKDSDMLIADICTSDNQRIFAVTRLPEKLTNRRMEMNTIWFKEGKVELIEENEKIINITFRVDFFVFGPSVFIAEKVNYEKVMNIREGMINKKTALLQKAQEVKRFKGLDILNDHIGQDMTLLRRAAKAHNSGNLDDAEFFKKLHELIKQYPQFGVNIDGEGHIVITKDNADAVLHLINDARAETLVKRQLIDIKSGDVVKLAN